MQGNIKNKIYMALFILYLFLYMSMNSFLMKKEIGTENLILMSKSISINFEVTALYL